jgi:hypothetical protein
MDLSALKTVLAYQSESDFGRFPCFSLSASRNLKIKHSAVAPIITAADL